MKITANGKEVEVEAGVNIETLLTVLKVEMPQYVTVQLNEELLDHDKFSLTIPKDGDTLEFLYFMGGGCQ